MKAKLTLAIIIILAATVYLFTGSAVNNTPVSPAPNVENEFLLGAMNTGLDYYYTHISGTFGFNLWHRYTGTTKWGGRTYPTGWQYFPNSAPGDTLFADSSAYISQVQSMLADIKNNNMAALMPRAKVEWLCFGQRSDYQCEETNIPDDFWFYAFLKHDLNFPVAVDYHDITQFRDNDSQWVRRCYGNPSNPPAGYVVRMLKANAEQCHRDITNTFAYRWDSECDWLIKPRIRIDSAYANDPANLDRLVCRVDVIDQDTNHIKSIDIRVRNFKKSLDSVYSGKYLEEFNFGSPWNDTSTNYRRGDWGYSWASASRGNDPNDPRNKADIKVWWYGICDMYIDYVRVDNDIADGLFKHEYDDWLRWEARDIACYQQGSAYKFYIEIFEFNNIPCMAYVSRKLDSISYANCQKHVSLVSIPIPLTYAGHVPWPDRLSVMNAEHFKRNFIDRIGAKEFMLGIYPFNFALTCGI